ncbi:hypothetical protein BGW36DRAFT_431108 [Talaromyces proteolyticus]|uniref:Uncharacterized protein n=1 Tax=Talaromyces proteolyticus TaxID=1131652 RepID=A0AAD4KGV2_9EURO|nr:uncharacterized protein BGW36DRAFT_431108 [Talaromyces proteolyticus]KAH8691864.1 hypothetical protein BGW36DRAFT_431108 [Talaromyces proteolyticus]
MTALFRWFRKSSCKRPDSLTSFEKPKPLYIPKNLEFACARNPEEKSGRLVVEMIWIDEIDIEKLEIRAIDQSIVKDGKIGVLFGCGDLEFELSVSRDYMKHTDQKVLNSSCEHHIDFILPGKKMPPSSANQVIRNQQRSEIATRLYLIDSWLLHEYQVAGRVKTSIKAPDYHKKGISTLENLLKEREAELTKFYVDELEANGEAKVDCSVEKLRQKVLQIRDRDPFVG